MSLITEFMATEQLMRAIYLTLLHSLWEGAVIAGFAGMVMIFSNRTSASSRYNFLAGSMAFFVICVIVTFIKFTATSSAVIAIEGTSTVLITSPQSQVLLTPIDQLFSVLSFYSNRIVLLWFLIICLKSLQLYLGLQHVSDLKTKHISEPGANWGTLVNTLSKRLAIQQSVKLLESSLTSVPLTVGYLKPIILVPLGMLTAIPADQVEAILLHELAHIKRKDYFINIFQSVIEVLFFFNPAIWWLSSLIRAERENCCDDLAIANSSNKINYVRALISFEEYRAQLPQIAVAFTGSQNTLLKRTRRIIYNQNHTLNPMEKFILTSGLVVSGLLSLAFTDGAKEQISKTLKPVVSKITNTFPTAGKAFVEFADTIPASSIHEVSINNGGLTTLNASHKGKAYKIVMNDDEVTDLYVDNQKIAKEKLGDYTEAMIEIFEWSDTTKNPGVQEGNETKLMFAATNNQERFHALANINLELHELKNLEKLVQLQKVEKVNRSVNQVLQREIAIAKALSKLASLQVIGDTITPKATPAIPGTPATPKEPQDLPAVPGTPVPQTAPKAPKVDTRKFKAAPASSLKGGVFKATPAEPIVVPAIEVHATPVVAPAIKVTPSVSTNFTYQPRQLKGVNNTNSSEFTRELNKELISEGLVKNPNDFSYKINNNELIIDGVKQGDETHNRIMAKVLKSGNHKIEFTYTKR